MPGPRLIPTAEPFFFPGGKTGCLLVHGFTGTPKEMRWMGEFLAQEGHTVLGVRLAGHATRPQDMQRMHWKDWLAGVEDGWHLLRGVCERIYVMGLSMGGCLSLLLAANFPASGVVAMSTPYALPADPRLPYVSLLSLLQPRMKKGAPDWRNLEAARDHVDYPFHPTRAIGELNHLLSEMRACLPRVTCPVLLAHSRQDEGVRPENMQAIYEHLGATDKHMLWVENSGHVIIREPQREIVFRAAADFIQRINGAA